MTSLVEEERGEESVLKISVETWRSGQQYLWRKQTEPINVPQATQRIVKILFRLNTVFYRIMAQVSFQIRYITVSV